MLQIIKGIISIGPGKLIFMDVGKSDCIQQALSLKKYLTCAKISEGIVIGRSLIIA